MKIGVIDTGVDQAHPFDPSGYSMPAGFPKGQVRFTTAKVIVARAFPPPRARNRSAGLAFDGDSLWARDTRGRDRRRQRTNTCERPDGVGRRAARVHRQLQGPGRDGLGLEPERNAPEIVAAIEAAVRDGMDVLNLSIGEPEIEPRRDVVALALDAAAEAGVVSVVAAGNDFNDLGAGSISSPANSLSAITVGAVEMTGAPSRGTHAEFSSVGPTTMSQRLKPDVAAPGVDVLSSVPDGWSSPGTSMASPHVAEPRRCRATPYGLDPTAGQVRARPVGHGRRRRERRRAAPTFQGGGVVSLTKADRPLVFAHFRASHSACSRAVRRRRTRSS